MNFSALGTMFLKGDCAFSKEVFSFSFDVDVCFQPLGDILCVSVGFAHTSLLGDSETSTPPPGVANRLHGRPSPRSP